MKKQTFSLRRSLIHLPVGALAAYLIWALLPIGLVFSAGWFLYEIIEDKHLKDYAFLDIMGFLVGIAIMGVVLSILGTG